MSGYKFSVWLTLCFSTSQCKAPREGEVVGWVEGMDAACSPSLPGASCCADTKRRGGGGLEASGKGGLYPKTIYSKVGRRGGERGDVREEIGLGVWDECGRVEDWRVCDLRDRIEAVKEENSELERLTGMLPRVKEWYALHQNTSAFMYICRSRLYLCQVSRTNASH